MQVLVVDVGGTHVKILAVGQETPREFVSGPSMTAEEMVSGVMKAAESWKYEAVSIGYPGLAGSGSIWRLPSGVRSSSSTTRPCKPWGL